MKAQARSIYRLASLAWDRLAAQLSGADLAVFHEFAPPPTGGGHQFLRALWAELSRRGLRLENNRISHSTRACLLNSFNFDPDRLRVFARPGVRLVHRVDGPVGLYRGQGPEIDRRIWQVNRELAQATVFQSQYSLEAHRKLGLEFNNPCVILNAADPTIFYPAGRGPWKPDRKIRLISSSWSNNLNKGADTYRWLDAHLDFNRFEYTFVGRSPVDFQRIRSIPPVPPVELAGLLRASDIYLAASRHDPCSNALIEALTCGLPAIYLKSGGHPEIAGQAGFGFDEPQEIPALLDRLVEEYRERQSLIRLPSLAEVADRYLEALGLAGPEVGR